MTDDRLILNLFPLLGKVRTSANWKRYFDIPRESPRDLFWDPRSLSSTSTIFHEPPRPVYPQRRSSWYAALFKPKRWRLKLSEAKRAAIRTRLPHDSIFVGDFRLSWIPSMRYIGVILGRRLIFGSHTNQMVSCFVATRSVVAPEKKNTLRPIFGSFISHLT